MTGEPIRLALATLFIGFLVAQVQHLYFDPMWQTRTGQPFQRRGDGPNEHARVAGTAKVSPLHDDLVVGVLLFRAHHADRFSRAMNLIAGERPSILGAVDLHKIVFAKRNPTWAGSIHQRCTWCLLSGRDRHGDKAEQDSQRHGKVAIHQHSLGRGHTG